ncbi:MAG: helix-turn-helix domain-containing protein [Pseudonocardiaceae bacterium]
MFAPARLRGYRHLRGLDHTTLAAAAHTTTPTLAAIENGHATPNTTLITALARALGCPPAQLHTTGDPTDNNGYWDVICAALPPLTNTEITTAATALRHPTKDHQSRHPGLVRVRLGLIDDQGTPTRP